MIDPKRIQPSGSDHHYLLGGGWDCFVSFLKRGRSRARRQVSTRLAEDRLLAAAASLAFGIVCSVSACVAAVSIASIVMTGSEPSRPFERLAQPDLWTTTPVRVDVSKQDYDRLPPVYSSYVAEQGSAKTKVAATRPMTPTKQVSQCINHDRSCDREVTSDQTYDAGESAAMAGTYGVVPATAGPAAAAWCAARYRSYRARDNTYQPFDGPRRSCLPPSTVDMASSEN